MGTMQLSRLLKIKTEVNHHARNDERGITAACRRARNDWGHTGRAFFSVIS